MTEQMAYKIPYSKNSLEKAILRLIASESYPTSGMSVEGITRLLYRHSMHRERALENVQTTIKKLAEEGKARPYFYSLEAGGFEIRWRTGNGKSLSAIVLSKMIVIEHLNELKAIHKRLESLLTQCKRQAKNDN